MVTVKYRCHTWLASYLFCRFLRGSQEGQIGNRRMGNIRDGITLKKKTGCARTPFYRLQAITTHWFRPNRAHQSRRLFEVASGSFESFVPRMIFDSTTAQKAGIECANTS